MLCYAMQCYAMPNFGQFSKKEALTKPKAPQNNNVGLLSGRGCIGILGSPEGVCVCVCVSKALLHWIRIQHLAFWHLAFAICHFGILTVSI